MPNIRLFGMSEGNGDDDDVDADDYDEDDDDGTSVCYGKKALERIKLSVDIIQS